MCVPNAAERLRNGAVGGRFSFHFPFTDFHYFAAAAKR